MMGWQWHQLDDMQIICTLLQTDNSAGIVTTVYRCSDTRGYYCGQDWVLSHWAHFTVLRFILYMYYCMLV